MGAKPGKTTQKTFNKLHTFVNRCPHNILRIWWPKTISNEELRETTQQITIISEIKIRKWKCIGHTLRKYQNDITRQELDLNPHGKRRKGRPRVTWKRTVLAELEEQNVCSKEAKQLAKNSDH
jgi:hypothetical protein